MGLDNWYELLKYHHVEMFQIFINWLSGNPDCDSDFKTRILNIFDINRFTAKELSTYVRESSLYSDKDILDALVPKTILLTEQNHVLTERNNYFNSKIPCMERQLEEHWKLVQEQRKETNDEIEHLKKNVELVEEYKDKMKQNFEIEKRDFVHEQLERFIKFYFKRNRRHKMTSKYEDSAFCTFERLEEAVDIFNKD